MHLPHGLIARFLLDLLIHQFGFGKDSTYQDKILEFFIQARTTPVLPELYS